MSTRAGQTGASDRIGAGEVLIGVGALVAVIGAFLPWLTAGGMFGDAATVTGIDMISDATLPIFSPVLTVGLAILALALTFALPDEDLARTGEIAAGVVIVLLAVVFIVSPETVFGEFEGMLVDTVADPGIGIIATLGAGIAIAIGGALNLSG